MQVPPPLGEGAADRTYNFPSCGPWGVTLDDQLRTESRLNASFSQDAWANAQLTGCLPRPCRPLPNWPPPPGQGFIYPTLEKKPQELLDLGVATGCPETYDLESPFAGGCELSLKAAAQRRPPVLDMVNPSECPPNGPRMSGDMAARVASRILGLPQPASAQPPPTLPPVDVRDTVPSPSSPSPYDKEACLLNNSKFSLTEVLPCTWNTIEGIAYDMKHWKDLPKPSTASKLGYVLGRDDRPFYLVLAAVGVVVAILLVRSLFFRSKGSRPSEHHRVVTTYTPYTPPAPYAQPCPAQQFVAVPIMVAPGGFAPTTSVPASVTPPTFRSAH